jgi:hypothetical protein
MDKNSRPPGNQPSSDKLTAKQWIVVGAVAAAATPAGPVAVATATVGIATGCYVSNKMGWTDK